MPKLLANPSDTYLDNTGHAVDYFWYDTITLDGFEYERMFSEYIYGYANFTTESKFQYYGATPGGTHTPSGAITVRATNLSSVPEPGTAIILVLDASVFVVGSRCR